MWFIEHEEGVYRQNLLSPVLYCSEGW